MKVFSGFRESGNFSDLMSLAMFAAIQDMVIPAAASKSLRKDVKKRAIG